MQWNVLKIKLSSHNCIPLAVDWAVLSDTEDKLDVDDAVLLIPEPWGDKPACWKCKRKLWREPTLQIHLSLHYRWKGPINLDTLSKILSFTLM